MKEIFTELYKKVLGFFQAQEKENVESKSLAVNRMKLVLMQDRTNLTPFLLEKMRGEMIEVLAKYVEMDKDALELNFEQEGDQMALMLSIPVIRAKDEEEIQEIIKAEDEAKAKAKAEKNEQEPKEEISEEYEEEVEETDEDIEEETEKDVCSCDLEESDEFSNSPDLIEEEIEEEASSEKPKKKS